MQAVSPLITSTDAHPKVSILVPTYNRSAYLRATLASILAQSFTDFEIIVADNCSTDDTATVVADCQDIRVRYIRNEFNLGAVGNYNKALQAARGDFIHLFSDDDVMGDSDSLSCKVDILEAMPTVGLVHSSILTIDGETTVIGGNWADDPANSNWALLKKSPLMRKEDAYPALYYGHNFITMSTVMLRRKVLIENRIAFNNQLNYLVDWALWLQMALFTDFYYIDKPLVHYRRHVTNETHLMNTTIIFNEMIVLKASLITLFPKLGQLLNIPDIVASTNIQLGKKSWLVRLRNIVGSKIKKSLQGAAMRQS